MSLEPPYPTPEGLAFEPDVSVGAWIGPRMMHADWTPGVPVGAIVPTGFEAYARVFHPAERPPGRTRVRWREIADEHGTTVHPQMQFSHVIGVHRFDLIRELSAPVEGCLPQDQTAVLASILEPHTTTPDRCRFAVWHGYGFGE